MKTKYFIIKHPRGNHSAEQVYFHGLIHFEDTCTECKKEFIRMRKFCKNKYAETSTNDTLRDFISYQMADMFFVKKTKDEQITWA